jgi:hypothetical protein
MSNDLGRTALTLGGQLGGALLVGGPIGAAIGGFLGASLGNALFPLAPIEGPRNVPQITAASYGAPIAEVYGRFRLGGVVIDCTEIREVQVTQEVGGKGAPSQEARSYEYYADVAVLLCRGPIAGVRRIWINNKIVYDVSASVSALSLMESGRLTDSIKLYTGTASQLSDATFEGQRGVGNVPAYRDYAYLVFDNLKLETGGLPAFQIEVVESGTLAVGAPQMIAQEYPAEAMALSYMTRDYWVGSYAFPIGGGTSRVVVHRHVTGQSNTGEQLTSYNVTGANPWSGLDLKSRTGTCVAGYWDKTLSGPSGIDIYTTGGSPLFARLTDNPLRLAPTAGFTNRGLAEYNGRVVGVRLGWLSASPETQALALWPLGGGFAASVALLSNHWGLAVDIAATGIYVLAARQDSVTQCTIRVLQYSELGTLLSQQDIVTLNYGGAASPSFVGAPSGGIEVDNDGSYNVLLADLNDPTPGGNGLRVYRARAGVVKLLFAGTQSSPLAGRPNGTWRFTVEGVALLVGNVRASGGQYGTQILPMQVLTPTTPSLQSVVGTICQRAGVPAAALDATALSGNITGYAWQGGQTMRAALEPLINTQFFSLNDIDGKLVATPRGGAVEMTLSADDLVRDDGADTIALDVTDESELPKQVTLGFISATQDYESGQQPARRINTTSTATDELNVAMVLTDDEASQIADKRLGALWGGQISARFAVSVRNLSIAPGAVISVPRGDRMLRLAVRKTTLNGNRIEVEAVSENAAAYTSWANGQVPATIPQTIAYLPLSRLAAVDAPLLRDSDDTPGFYVAAGPAVGGVGQWDGAVVQQQIGGEYSDLVALTQAAPIGQASTVLGTWPIGEYRWDKVSTVDIALYCGSIASGTRSAPNYVMIGSELVACTTVTALGGNAYRLSEFLRGLQGTEDAAATHAVGEQVLFVTGAGVRAVEESLSLNGTARTLRAATFGRSAVDAQTQPFTNANQRIKPVPVSHFAASLVSGGGAAFKWRRGARKYNRLANGAGVPLDEPAEQYEIEIANNAAPSTVLRTFSVSSARAFTGYSQAQFLADFPVTTDTGLARIYQVSNRVGRGRPRVVTFPVAKPEVLTKLLMHFDGADGSTVFVDSSTNNRTVTRVGTGVLSTAQIKFGSAAYLSAASSLLTVPSSDDFWFSANVNFTIDAWIYLTSSGGDRVICAWWQGTPVVLSWWFGIDVFDRLAFYYSSNGTAASFAEVTGTIALNTWTHVAVTRQGSVLRMFINGALSKQNNGFGSGALFQASPIPLAIGGQLGAINHFTGRVDELRILKGLADYTAAFTPPSSPYSNP